MKYLFIIPIIFLCASCEKSVDVDIPYDKDRLVVNNLFFADSSMYARVLISQRLTRSFNYIEPTSAVVTLTEDGVPRGVCSQIFINGSKYFKSPVVATIGKKYKFEVTATGYETVEGEDLVPTAVTGQANTVTTLTTTANSDFDRRIKFTFQDNPNEENFYLIKVYAADSNTTAVGPRFRYPNGRIGLSSEIEGFSNNQQAFLSFGDNQTYLTDESFNGRNITMNVSFDHYSGNYSHFAVEVTSLSKATYRYLKSRDQQDRSQGDPFAEATIIYNNIKNGFGIVGASTERIFYIRKI